MHRAVHTFVQQPILRPLYAFVLIFLYPGPMVQRRVVHVALGSRNDQFELLISAVVDVFWGMVMRNVVTEVLSAPKSSTAIALLLLLTL